MADYNVNRVNDFTTKLQALENPDLIIVWAKMCGWIPNYEAAEAHNKIVVEFFELSLWDQQGVLHQAITLITAAGRSAAHQASQKARQEDPL
jgi:hypothetical protein